jgi:hypothetical protein
VRKDLIRCRDVPMARPRKCERHVPTGSFSPPVFCQREMSMFSHSLTEDCDMWR